MTNEFIIAIHHEKGSYSDRWIDYCNKSNYNYIIVDCHKPDIIRQLEGCSYFLWNFHHAKLRDILFAKQLLYSIENMGIIVFPNFNTVWHFDDKIGQKYLLESIGAPLVNSYVYYDKISALEWAKTSTYPVVFKLRSGAGSINVKLIRSKSQALDIIKKVFSKGYSSKPLVYRMKENWPRFKKFKTLNYFRETIAGLKNYIFPTYQQKINNVIEKGYLYLQDFLPGNSCDIRIFVIGNRALGVKRLVRENDFRASGSNKLLYGKNDIDERCVKIAFDVNKKLKAQSVAYDFIFDQNNMPKIIEISYTSLVKGYDPCEGYWDSDLIWHPGQNICENWMLEDLLTLK